MSNLTIRILSSIFLSSIFIIGISWNSYTQWFLLTSVILIGVLEISLASRIRYAPKSPLILCFLTLPPALYALLFYYPDKDIFIYYHHNMFWFYLYLFVLCLVNLFNSKISVKNRFPQSFYQVSFLILVPTWFSTFFKILQPFEICNFLFWNYILVVILSDIGAYFTGRKFGKHPMIKISPKKTLEGLIGGLIISVTISTLLLSFSLHVNIYKLIIFNCILSLSSSIGDLFFSALKRHFEIKDFSNIIPGHGGVLDRFDSILFTIPIAYFLSPWIL